MQKEEIKINFRSSITGSSGSCRSSDATLQVVAFQVASSACLTPSRLGSPWRLAGRASMADTASAAATTTAA